MFNFEEVVGECGYVFFNVFFVKDGEVILEDRLHFLDAFVDKIWFFVLPIDKVFHIFYNEYFYKKK